MKIDLFGLSINEAFEKMYENLPTVMINNPAFLNIVNSIVNSYDELYIENGKVYYKKKEEMAYDNPMDSLLNDQGGTVSCDEFGNLIHDYNYNSLIRKYNQDGYGSDYEYINYINTFYSQKVYSPEGLQLINQSFSDNLEKNTSKSEVPPISLQVYKPTFHLTGQLDLPALYNNGKMFYMQRMQTNLGLAYVIEQENFSQTKSAKPAKTGTYPCILQHYLSMEIPAGCKSYEEQGLQQDQRVTLEMEYFIDKLDEIHSTDELAYNVFIHQIEKNYGSIENFLSYLGSFGLKNKFELMTNGSRS